MHNWILQYYSQAENIDTMCTSMLKVAQTHCLFLVTEATTLFRKFKEVFRLFALCHKVYDQNYVTDEKITELGRFSAVYLDHYTQACFTPNRCYIEKFMAYYHKEFPHATVLLKMHMLEEHVVPWLRKWHVRFGLLGVESIHAHFQQINI